MVSGQTLFSLLDEIQPKSDALANFARLSRATRLRMTLGLREADLMRMGLTATYCSACGAMVGERDEYQLQPHLRSSANALCESPGCLRQATHRIGPRHHRQCWCDIHITMVILGGVSSVQESGGNFAL